MFFLFLHLLAFFKYCKVCCVSALNKLARRNIKGIKYPHFPTSQTKHAFVGVGASLGLWEAVDFSSASSLGCTESVITKVPTSERSFLAHAGPLRNVCVWRGVRTYSSGCWSLHQCQLSHHNSCLVDFREVCPGSRVPPLRTPRQIILKTRHILTHQILLLERVADA